MPNINFNFEPFKLLFQNLLKDTGCEYQFTFYKKTNNVDDIIVEIYKAKDIATTPEDESLWGEFAKITYFHGHTHPIDRTGLWTAGKYSPPSASDYGKILLSYFKHRVKCALVFAPEGIYKIKLTNEIIDYLRKHTFKYDGGIDNVLFEYALKDDYPYDDIFEQVKDNIEYYTHVAHIALGQVPNFFKNHPEAKEDAKFKQITIEKYLELIRNTGFDIEFYLWESDKIKNIVIEVDDDSLEKVKTYMDKKQDSYFFSLNNMDLNLLEKKLKKYPEGKLFRDEEEFNILKINNIIDKIEIIKKRKEILNQIFNS